MIDTDKYEGQLEDDNTDTWVVWRIAKESIEEVKRLREGIEQMADTWLNNLEMDGRQKMIKMTNQLKDLIE